MGKELDISKFISELPEDKKKEYLKRLELCPFLAYKPHPIQEKFHKSTKRFRLFLGGNRGGKTYGGAMEAVWTATGTHPYKQVVVPNQGWVVSLDFPTSRDITQPILKQLLGGYIKKWREADKIIELTNGSTIGFKSADSGWDKFQGTKRHWIWFDEEPKHDIYMECRMRIADLKGDIWITETPMQGLSWIFDDIYEPWEQGVGDWEVIQGKTLDNPYIPRDEIENLMKEYTGQERDARLEGKFVLFAGRVYKEFERNIHVIPPFDIPSSWTRLRSIDPGINNPTACLWMAIDPDDNFYFYDEYYESERTIAENSTIIKALSGSQDISYTLIDPVYGQKRNEIEMTSIRQEYAKNGIPTLPGVKDVAAGISAVKKKLQVSEKTGKPEAYFFDTLTNTLKEISRYRWDEFRINTAEKNKKEAPKKLQDHLMDCMRWLCAAKPYYVDPQLMALTANDFTKLTKS